MRLPWHSTNAPGSVSGCVLTCLGREGLILEEGRGGGRVEDLMGGRLSSGRTKKGRFALRISEGLVAGEGSEGGRGGGRGGGELGSKTADES